MGQAQENRTQQANKVNQIQVQLKEKQNQVVRLNAENEALKLRQTQTQNDLEQANKVLQQAKQSHVNAETNLENLQKTYRTKIKQIEDTEQLIKTKQNQLEKARSKYFDAERTVNEIKSKLNRINQDIEKTTKNKQELNKQIEIQQKNLSTKQQESTNLRAKKTTLQNEIDRTKKAKLELEDQVETAREQLNAQNETMLNKTKQIHKVSIHLNNTKQQKSQIKAQHQNLTVQAELTRTQIAEYEQRLQQNQVDLDKLQIAENNQLKVQQIARDNLRNTNDNLERTAKNLQLKADKLNVKTNAYWNLEQHHIDLVSQINQSRQIQFKLDENVQDLNDKWLSKRMKITHDTKTIGELHESISEVKRKRRERLDKERNRVENTDINVEVNRLRNYSRNP